TILKLTKKYGLTLIIDVHEVPGLVRFSGWKDFRLWDGEFGYKYQDLLVDTWKQLANEFKNEHPRVIIFELLNEPEPKENDWNAKEDRGYLWDKLQLRLFQEIRKIDKTHTLVVAPPYSWRVNSLVGWNLPKEIAQDGKIMLAVHMYHPHDYTIQWLPWIDSKMSPKAYPGEFFDNSWEGILSYWDKKKITETLKPIVDFQKKYPNVPVIVTEFSVIRIAPGADQYLKDLTDLFFQLNIGWTYHVFKESEYFLKTKGIKSSSMWDLEVSPPYRFNVIKNAFRNIKK
nr:glycoside hydrolase family 5 protein [Planctomycetota bacterium]